MSASHWKTYALNSLGINGLRQSLGIQLREPEVFSEFKPNFKAAEIAWLATGTHMDGRDSVEFNGIHEDFLSARMSTPGAHGWKFGAAMRKIMMNLAFDLVRCLHVFYFSGLLIRIS